MFEDAFMRAWHNLISRPSGLFGFRFVVQPLVAVFWAVRGGLKDYRENKPAYFWALFTQPAHRRELLRDGWHSVGKLFLAAIVIDFVYQIIALHWFYPVEALLVAMFLAIIPYLFVRGPVNRIAAARKPPVPLAMPGQAKDITPAKKVGVL